MTLGFGDYGILERVAAGERIQYFEGTLWTMMGAGLVTVEADILQITEAGAAYLKAHKRPEFPKSKRQDREPTLCVVCKTTPTMPVCTACRDRLVAQDVNPDDENWFSNQCGDKIKFPRLDSAESAAADMEDKKRKQGSEKEFDFYECPWCQLFHIGGRHTGTISVASLEESGMVP